MQEKLALKHLLIVLLLLLPFQMPAQEHGDPQDTTKQETTEAESNEQILPEQNAIPGSNKAVFAQFSDFPNLHPLIVHFPIVLLFLAFITQLFGLIAYRKQMGLVTFFLLIGGFAGAVLASQVFHAHAAGLSEHAHKIFETHEYYGKATTWLSGIALVLKAISHFLLKRKTWAEIIVFLVITGSAITVGMAGHLGSQMVHIENIGPQGKHLEKHDHSEQEQHNE